jgi:DNA-directed RNA polymerase specialized sigma24 family protein
MTLRTGSKQPGRSRAAIDLASDRRLIGDAVAGLSDWDRAVVYRACYLGRTTRQIAAELRTDDELVKHALHRVMHALQETLQKRDTRRRHLRVV